MELIQARRNLFLYISYLICWVVVVSGQHFDPNMDDKAYLDQIEQDVQAEVEKTKLELVQQAKYTQDVATVYVGAKLKENLFKSLRVLAEQEKEMIKEAKKDLESKQPKQEDEDEEEESSRRPGNIIPVVGNLVKAIFGGNSINLTAYVEGASQFLPNPITQQLVGVVRLLGNNPSRTTTIPPPPQETTIITLNTTINGTQLPIRIAVPANASIASIINKNNNGSSSGETAEGGGDEDDAEEESSRNGIETRQLQLPSFTGSLNFLGTLFGGRGTTPKPATPVSVRRPSRPSSSNASGTTESAAGFDEDNRADGQATDSPQFSLDGLAMSVRTGLGDMIRIAPDFFRGAREAVRLISGLQGFLGELDI